MSFIDRTIKEKWESINNHNYNSITHFMLALKSISEQPEELKQLTPSEIVDLEENLNDIFELAESAIRELQLFAGDK